jgi:hypothetical protein
MKKLFQKIINKIETNTSKSPYFLDGKYLGIQFSDNNFHNIPEHSDNKIAFIDGGNIEIIGNNNFSLQLMRTYYSIYKNNKRIKSKKEDYLVFIEPEKERDNLVYKVEIYKNEDLIDEIRFKIIESNVQIKPESIINSTRRIYEIKTAQEIINHLKERDIIILDGNLRSENEIENNKLEELYNLINTKNLDLAAVSKTTSLLTDTGTNLVSYINTISKDKKWYYYPICINNNPKHKAELIIARLHDKSEYCFLIDIHPKTYNKEINEEQNDKSTNELIKKIISSLSHNSKDPIFLGYPYGLIEVDINARCQNNEQQFLQIRFMQSSKDKNKIKKLINSNKAHDILDSIK